jgi:hypothetical protein
MSKRRPLKVADHHIWRAAGKRFREVEKGAA